MTKKYNLFISSKNRDINDKIYDFNIYLKNQIIIGANEGININVMSFSMLNSMYNVNSITKNNTFIIKKTDTDGVSNPVYTNIIIPYGNYSVLTLKDTINSLLITNGLSNIYLSYNVPTNSYTYTNNNLTYKWFLIPSSCSKLLGISTTTEITNNYTSSYVNMVNYDNIIIKCKSLIFESLNQDNIKDKQNSLNVSDILFWTTKTDVEPFQMINYKNEDAGTSYSYNITNKNISILQLQLYNEYDELIVDAPDYTIELQLIVYEKNDAIFKEIGLQSLSILNDIYYSLLTLLFNRKKISY